MKKARARAEWPLLDRPPATTAVRECGVSKPQKRSGQIAKEGRQGCALRVTRAFFYPVERERHRASRTGDEKAHDRPRAVSATLLATRRPIPVHSMTEHIGRLERRTSSSAILSIRTSTEQGHIPSSKLVKKHLGCFTWVYDTSGNEILKKT